MMDYVIPYVTAFLVVSLAICGKVIIDLNSDLKEKEKCIEILRAEKWRLKRSKSRKVFRFLNPNLIRVDEEVRKYQEEGWTFDRENSVNGLLAFYKEEKYDDMIKLMHKNGGMI